MILAVYGTLRKGETLYGKARRMYGDDAMVWLGTARLRRYKMYDLGWFPALVETGRYKDEVIVDLMEVNREALETIRQWEGGYYEVGVKVNGFDARMFTMFERSMGDATVVEGGDWVEYWAEKQSLAY